jgi:transglutaminase-like putative cysteine protease
LYRIRIGCQLQYFSATPTPSVFVVQPPETARQRLAWEELEALGGTLAQAYGDAFGNRCQRVTLAAGETVVRFEALALVPEDADPVRADARQVPPQDLDAGLLRYTLPSRYCETDELLGFAWDTFARVPAGFARVQAICEWVHRNVRYRRGSSRPDWSAADAITAREGVCRDRAHVVVALCRAFNMPARYAVSYLPDIEVPDDGLPMDFHAYAEVWLEGGWQVFDPHRLQARKGRVFIASGLDAADAAFATLYGPASLTKFSVWADPVNVLGEKLGLVALAPSGHGPVAQEPAALDHLGHLGRDHGLPGRVPLTDLS